MDRKPEIGNLPKMIYHPRGLLYPASPTMAIHAVKKGSESNERLMNRFKKQVQDTRIVKAMRDRMRFGKRQTKRLVRLRALKREEFRRKNRKTKFYSNM